MATKGFVIPAQPHGWDSRLRTVIDELGLERRRLAQLQDEAGHLRRSDVLERLHACRSRIEQLNDEADSL